MFTTDSRTENFLTAMGIMFEYRNGLKLPDDFAKGSIEMGRRHLFDFKTNTNACGPQAALIEGFAALGRALQPAIQAMNQFAERCIANRRMRLALMRGNLAQWNWYATEHLRRCQY